MKQSAEGALGPCSEGPDLMFPIPSGRSEVVDLGTLILKPYSAGAQKSWIEPHGEDTRQVRVIQKGGAGAAGKEGREPW